MAFETKKFNLIPTNQDELSDISYRYEPISLKNVICKKTADKALIATRPECRFGVSVPPFFTAGTDPCFIDTFNSSAFFNIGDDLFYITSPISTPIKIGSSNDYQQYAHCIGAFADISGTENFFVKLGGNDEISYFDKSYSGVTNLSTGVGGTNAGILFNFDNYLLSYTEEDDSFFYSAVGNPLSWSALDFINVNRMVSIQPLDDKIYVGTKDKIIAFYNDGETPFVRYQGFQIDNSVHSMNMMCTDGNNLYFLDKTGRLCVANGSDYVVLNKRYITDYLNVLNIFEGAGLSRIVNLEYKELFGKKYIIFSTKSSLYNILVYDIELNCVYKWILSRSDRNLPGSFITKIENNGPNIITIDSISSGINFSVNYMIDPSVDPDVGAGYDEVGGLKVPYDQVVDFGYNDYGTQRRKMSRRIHITCDPWGCAGSEDGTMSLLYKDSSYESSYSAIQNFILEKTSSEVDPDQKFEARALGSYIRRSYRISADDEFTRLMITDIEEEIEILGS